MSCPFSTLFIGISSGWCRMGTAILSGAVSRDALGLRRLPATSATKNHTRRSSTQLAERPVAPPKELMRVGDSLRADVEGANAIGAVSVWLNRGRWPRSCQINPDLEVFTLTDGLPQLLELGDPRAA